MWGRLYTMVQSATGHTMLSVTNALWPAITGIITDNRCQFDSETWDALCEVLSRRTTVFDHTWYEKRQVAIPGAGMHTLLFSPVPDGQIAQLDHAAARFTGASGGQMYELFVQCDGGEPVKVAAANTGTVGARVTMAASALVEAGGNASIIFVAPGAGTLEAWLWGRYGMA